MFQSLLNSLHWLFNLGTATLIAVVIITTYIRKPEYKIIPIIIAALLLKFYPGVDLANIAFIISAAIGAAVFVKMPFDKRINLASAIILSVALFSFLSFLVSLIAR